MLTVEVRWLTAAQERGYLRRVCAMASFQGEPYPPAAGWMVKVGRLTVNLLRPDPGAQRWNNRRAA